MPVAVALFSVVITGMSLFGVILPRKLTALVRQFMIANGPNADYYPHWTQRLRPPGECRMEQAKRIGDER
jgi:hypothetical protein